MLCCVYLWICECVYVIVYVVLCTSVYMCICGHVCKYVYVIVYVVLCTSVYVVVCVCGYVNVCM